VLTGSRRRPADLSRRLRHAVDEADLARRALHRIDDLGDGAAGQCMGIEEPFLG
jgi:hypothetical protein